MNRRRFLAALPTATFAVSGCTALQDAPGETPTTTDTDTQQLRLANVPDFQTEDISFDAEIVQYPDEENPPRIEVRMTNEGATRDFGFGPVPPFSTTTSTDQALSLIPSTREPLGTKKFVPDAPRDGCWRSLHTPFTRSYLQWPEFAAGETISERYTILADPEAETCFPSGSHRFEDTFYVTDIHNPYDSTVDVVVP